MSQEMMSLEELAAFLQAERCIFELQNGELSPSVAITGVTADSRAVVPGMLFVAYKGEKTDGRKFIGRAIEKGAAAICVEAVDAEHFLREPLSVPLLLVQNPRQVFAHICNKFYGFPAEDLFCLGVTGTNGKTTVSWILSELFSLFKKPCVHIGTLGFRSAGPNSQEALNGAGKTTTPGVEELFSYLKRAKAAGMAAMTCEVSSHAIVQARVEEISWDGAIFTNLTRDHLDYHQTFEAYGAAKLELFSRLLPQSKKRKKFAAINIDDVFSAKIIAALSKHPDIEIVTFSVSNPEADVHVRHFEESFYQTTMTLVARGRELSTNTKLIGRYNIENVLASCAGALGSGYSLEEFCRCLPHVPRVPGRLELVAEAAIPVFVDYAHTPDGLLSVQRSLKPITKGKLITVFGCGGDRDRGKRPLMGKVVGELSDYCIVTSDNPRTENPEKIIEDILPGLREVSSSFEVLPDRTEAIQRAIERATENDVVLVAGKGHEDYQEINGIKYPFSDVEVCREILGRRLA